MWYKLTSYVIFLLLFSFLGCLTTETIMAATTTAQSGLSSRPSRTTVVRRQSPLPKILAISILVFVITIGVITWIISCCRETVPSEVRIFEEESQRQEQVEGQFERKQKPPQQELVGKKPGRDVEDPSRWRKGMEEKHKPVDLPEVLRKSNARDDDLAEKLEKGRDIKGKLQPQVEEQARQQPRKVVVSRDEVRTETRGVERVVRPDRQRGRVTFKEGKQLTVQDTEFSIGLPKRYTYVEMVKVTDNLNRSNKIGEGGCGNVFKGQLQDRTMVAVKLLNPNTGKVVDDFKNEVQALGRTSHFNLLKLMGYCAEDSHRVLVYEYMSNGSLNQWIFPFNNPTRPLSWLEMRHIIQGIAEGLVYLHENCEMKILHGDLKPANVLLDRNMNAKLGDFGLAKLLERDQTRTLNPYGGTPGYMAPEYHQGLGITEKVDVFSFGIVGLEVIFGKRYSELINLNIVTEANKMRELIKSTSEDLKKYSKDVEKVAGLAIRCLVREPDERPNMSQILAAIKGFDVKFKRSKS